MNSPQLIIALIQQEHRFAETSYRRACENRAGVAASAAVWETHNPDDGVGCLSQNPYNLDNAMQVEEHARLHYKQMTEAYEHAVHAFTTSAARITPREVYTPLRYDTSFSLDIRFDECSSSFFQDCLRYVFSNADIDVPAEVSEKLHDWYNKRG